MTSLEQFRKEAHAATTAKEVFNMITGDKDFDGTYVTLEQYSWDITLGIILSEAFSMGPFRVRQTPDGMVTYRTHSGEAEWVSGAIYLEDEQAFGVQFVGG